MKKFAFAAVLLLSTASFESNSAADLSPEAAAMDAEIKKMQDELQAKVEVYNEQVAQDAANHEVSVPEPVAKETPTTILPAQQKPTTTIPEKSDLEKRVESLERELKALKDAKPADGARTLEEAAATKKANDTAPLLPTNTPAVAQYNQALTLLENNEFEKAAGAFEQILKDYPNDPYAHKAQAHLGEVFRKLGKMEEAEKAYSLALTYNLESPIMVECRLGLAETLLSLNRLKPACDQLVIVQKESIDPTQKRRLQEALGTASCQKHSG